MTLNNRDGQALLPAMGPSTFVHLLYVPQQLARSRVGEEHWLGDPWSPQFISALLEQASVALRHSVPPLCACRPLSSH